MLRGTDDQDADRRAQAIVGQPSHEVTFEAIGALVAELDAGRRLATLAGLLTTVGRWALYDAWEPARRAEFATLLRDHRQFGYARRLLGRVLTDGPDSEPLRREYAQCTYEDMELPAVRRLDRALQILQDGDLLEHSTSAETLAIAGAIHRRRFQAAARTDDLERALWYLDRAFALKDDPEHRYVGVACAFVCDQLAGQETAGLGLADEAARLRARADAIRAETVDAPPPRQDMWRDATLGEALFGLGRFAEAGEHLARAAAAAPQLWQLESTAMQLAELARLRGYDTPEAYGALKAIVGGNEGAVRRAQIGKVGLALSGGGYRASLFHLGVLARLAECDVLRGVEVLSCVSGGSIVGALYYLRLRELLQSTPDAQLDRDAYVGLVRELSGEFLAGVRRNLRGRLGTNIVGDLRMLATRYSRTDRAIELYDDMFYGRVPKDGGGRWYMTDLCITPSGSESGFSLRYENWLRAAKVPMIVLNATSLNTGHNWQFTASWMGEPPVGIDEQVDANRRLRRVYYDEAPPPHGRTPLSTAVAASACVPMLFPPVRLERLYEGDGDGGPLDVELVDGGVYDNQGVASLLAEDCTVILVSDASGQMADAQKPGRLLLGVADRTQSVLTTRVRKAQYDDLLDRRRSGTLRGLMTVHLKKGLPAAPRDWVGCDEPYEPEDDALPAGVGAQTSPYGIDPGVQRALAELRTDLDSFSDDEAYSLMAAGYAMTTHELPHALPDLPPGASERWPFSGAIAGLADPSHDGRLAKKLGVGRSRFFRRLAALRHR